MGTQPIEAITYRDLTSEIIEHLSPYEAELLTFRLLAERARIKEHGKILSWSEFNENPSPLINRLLAKTVVAQLDPTHLYGVGPDQAVVLSIESSGSYFATEVSHALVQQYPQLKREPRLIRARKVPAGESPSQATSTNRFFATVTPITSGGEKRVLMTSIPEDDDLLDHVTHVFVVDDFRATGNTHRGGIELARLMFGRNGLTIFPVAALGKPDQSTVTLSENGGKVADTITALDVHFWADGETGHAMIRANGFEPMPMQRATAADFT